MRRIYPYVLLAWAAALTAGAEILVTVDGTEIATRGPWQRQGKMVVFTLANGQLSALRSEDVDFEATERRNAPAPGVGSGTTAPAAPRPTAKIVITDADVAHVEPAPDPALDEPTGDAEEDEAGAAAGAPAASPVRVIAWDEEDPEDGDGRVVFGTLRNDGNSFAAGISLEISVFADGGALAGTQTVTPATTSLRPGESTTFRAQFRDVFTIAATRMVVRSLDLDVGGPEERPEAELDGS
ncbi:MAG: FxLYD domain-containing protein [Acidobacteriota bacterium]|nr:FxLYD domain-containing protein [Acidobacteriota bacterium]MDH3521951.1 FxLYD domain-containing protein [Acidobacteriota bacterium]